MSKSDKEEIYKAINNVSNKVNGIALKLDNLIMRLNADAQERIDLNSNGIDDVAGIVSTHDEAIEELATLLAEMEES